MYQSFLSPTNLDIFPYRIASFHLVARGITDGTNRWIDGLAELEVGRRSESLRDLSSRFQNLKVEQDNGR